MASPHHQFLSVTAVKIVSFAGASVLAGLTVLTHAAQVLRLSFGRYALLGVATASVALLGALVVSRRWRSQVTVRDRGILLLVLLMAVAGAGLALVIHRPDVDDSYYVPNAVYFVENPAARMGFDIHYLYTDGRPFVSLCWATSMPLEYAKAIAAHYAGVEYLLVYHVFGAALVGFLIPLAVFYATSHFTGGSGYGAFGALMTVAAMLLLGETHRTCGNLSFARAFQGKALLFAVGIPLFVGFSFDYFRKPSLLSWLPLLAVAISMLGATASTLLVIPALASVLAIAHLATSEHFKRSLAGFSLYFAALGYVLLYALLVFPHAALHLGCESVVNEGWPRSFAGHLKFLICPDLPLTPCAAVVSGVLVGVFCPKRKVLLVWVGASVLLYLNPWAASWLIDQAIGPNLYWRLFYILPFPLMVGIGFSCALRQLRSRAAGNAGKAVVLVCALVLMMLVFHLREGSIFCAGNRVELARPGYQLDSADLASAREILKRAPPGVMLAPPKMARTIVMLSAKCPQIRVRGLAARAWLGSRGQGEEARLRRSAAECLAGRCSDLDALDRVMHRHPDIRSIVLARSVWGEARARRCLAEHGYSLHALIGQDRVLAWKGEEAPGPDGRQPPEETA